jgi:hypothetical protein
MEPRMKSTDAGEWLGSSKIAKVVTDHWVKNLHATVDRFSADYGLGPWKIAELKAPLVREVEFRGEPADIYWLAAMAEVGPLAVEVLEVRGGSDAVVRWAEELPDGYWHFVSYHSELADAEDARKSLDALGIPVVLSGRVGGTKFFMFDTDQLFGRMFEIAGGDLSGVEWQSLTH